MCHRGGCPLRYFGIVCGDCYPWKVHRVLSLRVASIFWNSRSPCPTPRLRDISLHRASASQPARARKVSHLLEPGCPATNAGATRHPVCLQLSLRCGARANKTIASVPVARPLLFFLPTATQNQPHNHRCMVIFHTHNSTRDEWAAMASGHPTSVHAAIRCYNGQHYGTQHLGPFRRASSRPWPSPPIFPRE